MNDAKSDRIAVNVMPRPHSKPNPSMRIGDSAATIITRKILMTTWAK